MKKQIIFGVLFFSQWLFSQSDVTNVIIGGQLLLKGITELKSSLASSKAKGTVVESFCVKNKLQDKITYKIAGKQEDGCEFLKELIIPKDGKECLFLFPKGVYNFEILLTNNEVFKKGECLIDCDQILVIK